MTIWLTMLQAKRDAWSLSNSKYLLCFYTTFSNTWLNLSLCLRHFLWQSISQCSSSWGSFPDIQPKFSPKFFLSDDCLFLARWCKQHSHFPDKEIKVSNQRVRAWRGEQFKLKGVLTTYLLFQQSMQSVPCEEKMSYLWLSGGYGD